MRASLLLTLLFIGTMSASAQLSSRSIEAAQEYSASHHGIGLIIQENGSIRHENYYEGGARDAAVHIYSGTKSFFGVLAVIAEKEGLLQLDEPVSATIESWRSDPRKSQITLRDLLQFTSGLEDGFEEIYGSPNEDKIARSLQLSTTADRGATFRYGPAHLNVFCAVLDEKLASRGTGYERYLRQKLIDPLGIAITRWQEDAAGNVVPSAGMYLTGRDWLKFGDMIVQGGTANGRRIVPTERLAQCFRPSGMNSSFGLCFWLNGYCNAPDAREWDVEETLDQKDPPEDWRRTCLSEAAPEDLFTSLGSRFQRLYICPSRQLVVVHQGTSGNTFRDAEFLRILFADAVGPASPSRSKKRGTKFFEGLFKK